MEPTISYFNPSSRTILLVDEAFILKSRAKFQFTKNIFIRKFQNLNLECVVELSNVWVMNRKQESTSSPLLQLARTVMSHNLLDSFDVSHLAVLP